MKKLALLVLISSPLFMNAMEGETPLQEQSTAQLLATLRQRTQRARERNGGIQQELQSMPTQEDVDRISEDTSEKEVTPSSYYDYFKTWGTRAALVGAGGLAVYFGFPREVEVIAPEPEVRGKIAGVILKAGIFLVKLAQRHSK